MNVVNITDYNANVGLDTSYLFIQSHWILPFSQACPLTLTSRFYFRKMRDSIACLRYWLVSLFTSIGMKHVISCTCLTSDNASFNPLSPNFWMTFEKLHVWANIWPTTVVSSVVYLIVWSFSSTVFVIKLLLWYIFPLIVGANLWIGVACRVDLLTGCGISSWLIVMMGFIPQYPLSESKLIHYLTIVVSIFQFIHYMSYHILWLVHITLHLHHPLLWLIHRHHHFNHNPRELVPLYDL